MAEDERKKLEQARAQAATQANVLLANLMASSHPKAVPPAK